MKPASILPRPNLLTKSCAPNAVSLWFSNAICSQTPAFHHKQVLISHHPSHLAAGSLLAAFFCFHPLPIPILSAPCTSISSNAKMLFPCTITVSCTSLSWDEKARKVLIPNSALDRVVRAGGLVQLGQMRRRIPLLRFFPFSPHQSLIRWALTQRIKISA